MTTNLPAQDPPLDSDGRTTVFRIVQEALTNVARHAEAQNVMLSLLVEDEDLHVLIADDGRGITQSQLNDRRSLGLLGLRERATTAGGTVSIVGRPDDGTDVSLTIPLRAAQT